MSEFKDIDVFELVALVGTTETELKPEGADTGEVPEGKTRKIYGYFFNEQSGATNTVRLGIYNGENLEKAVLIKIAALDTIDFRSTVPWLTIREGRTLKAVADADSVMVVLQCKDI